MTKDVIPDVGFSDNTNQRTPCVLVLDVSGSMAGMPIEQLNAGLKTLEAQLKANPMTALRVQLLVILVGGNDEAKVEHEWCDAIDFETPVLEANGTTPLGKGMALALRRVDDQKRAYDANGVSSTRPWILLISDGEPTDLDWEQVAEQCLTAEANKKVTIYPIGTDSANFDALNRFSKNGAKKLEGLNFNELFVWLSRSMTAVSSSAPGQKVQLPTANWSQADT